MNRRLMFAALWIGVAVACCAVGLFLFTQLDEPDCDAVLLVAVSGVPSLAVGHPETAAAQLAECKATESLFLSLDHVAVALCAGATLSLAAALLLRIRLG